MALQVRASRYLPWRHVVVIAIATYLFLGGASAVFAGDGGFVCLDNVTKEQWVPPTVNPHGVARMRSALLPLRIYAIRDSVGGGGASTAQIDSTVTRLVAQYAQHSIFFDIVYDEIWDTDALNADADVFALMTSTSELCAALAPAPSGFQFSAGTAQGAPGQKCVVWVRGSWDSSVLSHEIGHCLGLWHTFESTFCNGLNDDCTVCGDLVCDTAWNELGSTMRDIVDISTCEYDTPRPPIADPTNIMSYSWPTCLSVVTDGQSERMLYFIETDEFLSSIVERPVALYENKSSDTNLDYDGTPYSSVALDYNADDLEDLFISMRDNFGSLQKETNLAFSQVPQFTDRTEYDIASASRPQVGLRGVAVADYDNDGRIDLFAAADSIPRIYHNNNGTFADSASALGLAALADSSYAGAWGDFDRDGQIDLYVCRGAGGDDDPTSANMTAVHGRLLRNDVRASGTFVDRSDSLGAAANTFGASVAASWADVDGDKDLDLFVGDLRDAGGSASSRLYLNDGAGGLSESFAARFSGLTIENVNSVAWVDMNCDGKLDLVLGGESAPPTAYINDGYGDFDNTEPVSVALAAASNGVRPVDFDLDGSPDLVALPRESTDHRWLFWNRTIDAKLTLLDQSDFVGFVDSTGRVDGLAMADFNGDGDSDLYFGRAVATDDYFYRAKTITGDEPVGDWVGVRLVAGGGNNGSAIGATVRFYIASPSFQQIQTVDGGSGKGGQADNTLICGLADRTGTVTAEITWPGGYVQTETLTRGQVTTVTDATTPGIPSSVSGVYTAIPGGGAEFTFNWDTAYSCDPSLDKITLTDPANQPSQCVMGTVVLTPGSFDATHSVMAKAGGGYHHTLTWPLECNAPCSYSYVIESAADSTHKNAMTTSKKINMNVCITQ